MPTRSLFLSFSGRINRATYWTRAFPVLLALGLVVNLILLIEVKLGGKPGPVSMLVSLCGLWPSLAVTVKRLHDRGRSAWFLLIILVPVIGGIWLLVEVWFMPGTDAPNRFGAPPTDSPTRPVVAVVSVAIMALVAAAVGYQSLFHGQTPALIVVQPAKLAPSIDSPASLVPDAPSLPVFERASPLKSDDPEPPSKSD